MRLFQPPPDGATIVSGGVLSPDGESLTFVARDNVERPETALWLRTLHSSELKASTTRRGLRSRFGLLIRAGIGFLANGELLAVQRGDGAVRTVATVGMSFAGGTWAPDDTILFADWAEGPLHRPRSGGEPTPSPTLDQAAQDIAFSWPQFLPDGRHFLYQVVSLDADRTGAYVGDLDTRRACALLDTESPAMFAPPRHLLHIQRDMLIAEEFDVEHLQLTGRATVLARGVSPPSLADEQRRLGRRRSHCVPRRNPPAAARLGGRAGEVLSTVQMPAEIFNPAMSPDGSHLLATSSVTTNPGLWLASLSRAEYERTRDRRDRAAVVAGRRRDRLHGAGGFDLSDSPYVERRALGVGSVTGGRENPERLVSRRRCTSCYTQTRRADQARSLGDPGRGRRDVPDSQRLHQRAASATSRRTADWIAYVADESGALEVYVQRYPELGERYKVSESAAAGNRNGDKIKASSSTSRRIAPLVAVS